MMFLYILNNCLFIYLNSINISGFLKAVDTEGLILSFFFRHETRCFITESGSAGFHRALDVLNSSLLSKYFIISVGGAMF